MRSKPNPVAAQDAPALLSYRRSLATWQPDDAWFAREWLLVDGHGGFAAGTLADLPTRRYHGWLCAWPESLEKRQLFVARCDESLVTADGERSLLCSRWADGTLQAPAAALRFTPWPLPTWDYEVGELRLRRRLAMTGRSGVVLVAWQNTGKEPLRLLVKPLLPLRPIDQLSQGEPPTTTTAVLAAGLRWQPRAEVPPLWLSSDAPLAFTAAPVLYRGVEYALDEWRGYDHVEDLWCPGAVELELQPGQQRVLAFSVDEPVVEPAAELATAERARSGRLQQLARRFAGNELRLARGADDFFYTAPGGRLGVLAGFPWFVEWGRDVFVALPGLSLARGERARCEEVLQGALPFLQDGLLPNIYGRSAADSHYGSADAALWFALAVRRWQQAGGSEALLRERFAPALRQIAEACRRGTGLGMAMDQDGLLRAGSREHNATWMDAVSEGGPVTPRPGKAVELNALWYSLLAQLAELEGGAYHGLRARCGKSFVARFWLADDGWLADAVDGEVVDRSVRPNMVIAAALELSPLNRAQRLAVVQKAEAELMTTHGLRTLSFKDPAYQGRYEGGCVGRDRAYHQGTAWPWLVGFYVEAALRAATQAERPKMQGRLRRRLADLLADVDATGLDHLSEVYDGDAPQRPEGSFAQAWNSGEVLRAIQLCRDGLQ